MVTIFDVGEHDGRTFMVMELLTGGTVADKLRSGDRLEAVFYEDYVMSYCPTCQTGGKLLKDRRLSRLLK